MDDLLRAQSAIEYLTTYGWAIIIITIVLVAMFELGLFQPPVSTTCVFPAEFGCLTAILYSTTGQVNLTLQQSTQSTINITAYGCNNSGNPSNMVLPFNPPSNQITVPIGGTFTFNVLCYNNGTAVSITPGQLFKGYVVLNYTTLTSGFPHTAVGQLVAKAV
jgi:hypothetical protein